MSRVKDLNYPQRSLVLALLSGVVIIPVGHFLGARFWNKDLGGSPTSHLKWGTRAAELETYILIHMLYPDQTTDKYDEKTERYCVETFIVSNRFVPTLGELLPKLNLILCQMLLFSCCFEPQVVGW